jgi:hypothetical protein
MLDQCPVRAPNHRTKGCQPREAVGNFRLEITPELRLRDDLYALQQTTESKERYRIRAGIEATNSELKRTHGIGRLRVRRLVKVCFAVACKVIVCNIKGWAKAFVATPKRGLGECLPALYAHVVAVVRLGRKTPFAGEADRRDGDKPVTDLMRQKERLLLSVSRPFGAICVGVTCG